MHQMLMTFCDHSFVKARVDRIIAIKTDHSNLGTGRIAAGRRVVEKIPTSAAGQQRGILVVSLQEIPTFPFQNASFLLNTTMHPPR